MLEKYKAWRHKNHERMLSMSKRTRILCLVFAAIVIFVGVTMINITDPQIHWTGNDKPTLSYILIVMPTIFVATTLMFIALFQTMDRAMDRMHAIIKKQ